jgi:hypothetical protein
MEGSRIFLTSTVYNKLTLRFKEKRGYPPPFHFYPFLRHPLIRPFVATPPFYSTLSLPLLSPLEPEVVTDRIISLLVCLTLCDP